MKRPRKAQKVSDKDLTRLLKLAAEVADSGVTIRLKADLVYAMCKELVELRDELFRIRVCDTVDELLDFDEILDADD